MTSGPLVAVVLQGDAAIEVVRGLNGATDGRKAAPGTIRGDLSLSNRENLVHGSDSSESADREIGHLVPGALTRVSFTGQPVKLSLSRSSLWPSTRFTGQPVNSPPDRNHIRHIRHGVPAPYGARSFLASTCREGRCPAPPRLPRTLPRTRTGRMANNLVGRDMAVDLGTANTLVYVRGRGVLVDEPSVVAVNDATGELVAVGRDAKQMLGRTPEDISVIRPLQDGVIADFEATEQMLRHFIALVHRRRYLAKPRIVVCVPSGITPVEQRAVKEAAYQAGARRVFIIEEPMAAAIGAGLPVHKPTGNMVVDIGGGTTEVAVISLGGIVTSLSVRTAGDELDRAITTWMKKEHALLLGEATAEEVKMTLGSAFPGPLDTTAEVRGRDLVSGLPRTVPVTSGRGPPARSRSRCTRSSTPSASPSTRPRPSWPATSWTAASCSPAAAPCCAVSTSGCATRPACRSTSPTTR